MTAPELFPFQHEGRDWLITRLWALLADEMGLGKSAQSICAADAINAERILILCPAIARRTWVREFKTFSSRARDFQLVESRGKTQYNEKSSVICSFDLVDDIPATQAFDLLLIDEAHYLKSIEAKRAKKILGKNGLVHRAKRVWALTGTPAPNHAGELWPILYTFGATSLSYEKFVGTYCETMHTARGPRITGTKISKIPELRRIIAKVTLRRRKDDVLKDLPPIHYTERIVEPGFVDIDSESSFVHFTFPPERRQELEELLNRERKMLEDMVDKVALGNDGMRMLEALARSISTLRRYNGLQKVGPVAEIIEEELMFNAYDKIVIFCIHRDVIEGLRVKLRRYRPVTLYGETPPDKRQENIDKFQKDPKCRVFIGNIKACGTNITLTAAHHVTFIEQEWVPGDNAQAAMRCHRIGQTKPVFVRVITLAESIDQKVAGVLKRKTRELTEVFLDERKALLNRESGATEFERIDS